MKIPCLSVISLTILSNTCSYCSGTCLRLCITIDIVLDKYTKWVIVIPTSKILTWIQLSDDVQPLVEGHSTACLTDKMTDQIRLAWSNGRSSTWTWAPLCLSFLHTEPLSALSMPLCSMYVFWSIYANMHTDHCARSRSWVSDIKPQWNTGNIRHLTVSYSPHWVCAPCIMHPVCQSI